MSEQLDFSDIVVKKAIKLEEGKYKGLINDVQRTKTPFDYIRYMVHVKDEEKDIDVSLPLSFPMSITVDDKGEPSTSHAKFLVSMGLKIAENDKPDLTKVTGKEISFLIQDKVVKDKGTFSDIVKSSVKLVKQAE